jgi:hypothetical protein
MPEWYVYDRNGKKRKALPHEIPKPIEHGCDLTNGDAVHVDNFKPKTRGDRDVHKKNRKNAQD